MKVTFQPAFVHTALLASVLFWAFTPCTVRMAAAMNNMAQMDPSLNPVAPCIAPLGMAEQPCPKAGLNVTTPFERIGTVPCQYRTHFSSPEYHAAACEEDPRC